VAVQFGSTAGIAQCTTRNVAGGQIKQITAQHLWFIFQKFRFIFVTKTAVQP